MRHVYADSYIVTVRKVGEDLSFENLLIMPYPTQEAAYNAFDWWITTGRKQLGATTVIVKHGGNLRMWGKCL